MASLLNGNGSSTLLHHTSSSIVRHSSQHSQPDRLGLHNDNNNNKNDDTHNHNGNGGGDETKYQKHKRRKRKQIQRRFVLWSTVGISSWLLSMILVWYLSTHANHNAFQQELLWERAQLLEQQRMGGGSGTDEIAWSTDNQHSKRNGGGHSLRDWMHLKSNRDHDPNERQSLRKEGTSPARNGDDAAHMASQNSLLQEFERLDQDIVQNRKGGIRWIVSKLLPALPGSPPNPVVNDVLPPHGKHQHQNHGKSQKLENGFQPFHANRRGINMAWELERYEEQPPLIDYAKHSYQYPQIALEPPVSGGYPPLSTLGDILKRWPQDNLDNPPLPFVETLYHFNYSDPVERAAAAKFRDAELPFKVYDVPELPTKKWKDDDYIIRNFDHGFVAKGTAQESPNNYFAFYTAHSWDVVTMGPPPVRFNDWSYSKWAKHATYADSTRLPSDQPHFYWQSGTPKTERYAPKAMQSFISLDLPSFSSNSANFFLFHPEEQKGIQCRFGERGVTAATHYDGGRNMVAMITGAKRYILSPPRECDKLGIVTSRGNSVFRHSLLNFAHLQYLEDDNATSAEGIQMSPEERAWLERAKVSMAIDTVLKEGEVLYIPSHWFHYITSLQKSAQCNVRSGIDLVGTKEFGGSEDVYQCGAPA